MEAWAATGLGPFWQPQPQGAPGQVVQRQAVDCWVSFMADLLGGSTTGCHRWLHFRRRALFPTGDCDERSARVPDRSRRSTERFGTSNGPGLGMDRERVFYPAVAIAVTSYYLAFAAADGRSEVWLAEGAIAAVFIAGAVLGFKRNPWLAVVALGGHGLMDVFHHLLVHNEGVPRAWPGFCMSFDVTAAAVVAGRMLIRVRGGGAPQRLEPR
jgi:hypothetical protein